MGNFFLLFYLNCLLSFKKVLLFFSCFILLLLLFYYVSLSSFFFFGEKRESELHSFSQNKIFIHYYSD